MQIYAFLIIVLLAPCTGYAGGHIGNIVTIAGGIGDWGPATSAEINNPYGVTVDLSGNIFIADSYNQRIRKVDISGVITTVAGSGADGFHGDGGPATSAAFHLPLAVAVDASGNIYIADNGTGRIRKVDTSGVITTVAGNNRLGGYSGDGGPAASAELNYPQGVAVDSSGNLYIADFGNHRIRKVDASGVITTVAGNGTEGYSGDGGPATSAEFDHPSSVAADSSGNIYIADSYNHRIRKIDASGVITTVAGNGTDGFSGDGGPATAAQLDYPSSVTVDFSGNIYTAANFNHRIRKVDTSGVITTFAGNGTEGFSGDGGPATLAELDHPSSVAADSSGNIYIADFVNNRIRKVNTSGIITTVAGQGITGFNGDGGLASLAEVHHPSGVAVNPSGNIYIAELYTHRIRKVDTSGGITTVAGNGTFGFSGDGGPATAAELNQPSSVAVDSAGNIYIADSYNNRIRKVDTSGGITTVAGNGTFGFSGDGGPATAAELNQPSSVAVDSAGNIYIADSYNNRIRKVDTSGGITTVAGNGTFGFSGDGGPATAAELNQPSSVAVDSAGNIYIADSANNRIRKVDTSGGITTVAGNGTFGFSGDGGPATAAELNQPEGMAVDSAGNIYIADYYNNRIRKVDTSGAITTVAGNGTKGFSGDGGSATSTELNYPTGVAVDSSGNIYIADSYNNRIREVYFAYIWTKLPGVIMSAPAIVWNPTANAIQMVVRGSSNSIWSSTYNANGTFNNDWSQIPGAIMSPPAIAWNPVSSKMHMVVQGSGNSIWSSTYNANGTFSNDWAQIPGAIMSAPAIAWNPVSSKMHMVVQGSGNSIWSSTFSSSGTFNSDWNQLPGGIFNSPAIVWNSANNEIQMAVEGDGNSIWTSTFNSVGNFNGDWAPIPGAISSAPAIAWNHTANAIQMAVEGDGNSIWTSTFNSVGNFNRDWAPIPGAISSALATVWNPIKCNFLIVVRGLDNSIWSLDY